MADRRKLGNIAAALPIFGAVVILPPIVGIFATDARIEGVPMIVVYMFAMWLALIGGTYFLSQRLGAHVEDSTAMEDEESGAG